MKSNKMRVPHGEKYWYIDDSMNVMFAYDDRNEADSKQYKSGNYFNDEKDANAVLEKFKAILKGADVIKTSDIDYVENEIHKIVNEITQGYDRVYVADGEGNIHGDTTYEELTDYLRLIVDIFRNKIMK